jgi:hypothetical protein
MTHSRSPHTTVPFDLYRDIHKAIRVALFEVVAEAGRLDPSDRPARIAHAGRVRDLVRFLVFHADHEDRSVEHAIQRVLPDRAEAIAVEHAVFERRMDNLIELADLAFDTDRTDDRAAVHHLYLELAAFTSSYLAHQDMEERVVMPALWNALGLEPLLAMHADILQNISPDDMGWSLSMMLPAMNVDDRTEMLHDMRAEAPPEAFAGVCALASEVLETPDHIALMARLDLVSAS